MSGYPLKSKKEMISKLMSSSLETGNAGERLACAINRMFHYWLTSVKSKIFSRLCLKSQIFPKSGLNL